MPSPYQAITPESAGVIFLGFCKGRGLDLHDIAENLAVGVETVRKWSNGKLPFPLDKMLKIQHLLGLSEERLHAFNALCDPFRADHDRPLGLNPEWLEQEQHPPHTYAGLYLRALRVRHFISMDEMASDLGITQDVYAKMEVGAVRVPPGRLPEINKILELTEGEAARLKSLAKIRPPKAVEPQHKKREPNGVRVMHGLDAEWLANHPPVTRMGRHVRALRFSRMMSRVELAEGMNITEPQLRSIESGAHPITSAHIEGIRKTLALRDEEHAILVDLQKPTPASESKAEDTDAHWVTKLHDMKQAGELLRYYRNNRGISMIDLADALGLDPKTKALSNMETGSIPIPKKYLQPISRILNLTPDETNLLDECMARRRLAMKNAKAGIGSTVLVEQFARTQGVPNESPSL